MPERQQDHRGITLAIAAVLPDSLDEPLNLALGEILARAQLRIGLLARPKVCACAPRSNTEPRGVTIRSIASGAHYTSRERPPTEAAYCCEPK
jgi:hypothetical protein